MVSASPGASVGSAMVGGTLGVALATGSSPAPAPAPAPDHVAVQSPPAKPIQAGQTMSAIFGNLRVILSAGLSPYGLRLDVQAYQCEERKCEKREGGSFAFLVFLNNDAKLFQPPAVLIDGGVDLFRPSIITLDDK